MKKIFYFEGNTDGTVGGSYLLMYDLVHGLDRNKFEPVVGFYVDNFLVSRLRENGIETILFDLPEPVTFKTPFLNTLLAPVKKLINFYSRLIAPSMQFSSFLKVNNINLVNLNNSIRANHPWMIAAKLAHVKCITHEMGINHSFTLISKYLGKRLDAIVCLSHAIHNEMKKAGANFNNTHVVHSGIDLTRYTIEQSPEKLREKFLFGIDDPIVGVVGNVKWWKGQETLVRAIPELVGKYPNIRCMLVGDLPDYASDYHDTLRGVIRDAGIEKNVIFTGFQKNSIDFMNLMDIVIHTSVEPEPFGIVTLEAMSVKKPLISTTIGGPAEVVTNDESGILIDPGKPNLLAKKIDLLLSDREYAKRIGDNGYDNLQQNFTFEKCLNGTVTIYNDIFNNH